MKYDKNPETGKLTEMENIPRNPPRKKKPEKSTTTDSKASTPSEPTVAPVTPIKSKTNGGSE